MSTSAEIAAAYVAIMRQLQQVNSGCFAAGSLLLYDWCLCIGEEVDLIWRSKWSIPKVMYIFSRYFAVVELWITIVGLAGGVPFHLCRSFILLQLIGLPLLSFSSNYVLCLRLEALYSDCPIFVKVVYTVWLLEFTIGFLFSVIYAATLELLPSGSLFNLPLCLGKNPSQVFLTAPWVLSTSLSLFFFVAMMARVIYSYKVDKLLPTPLMTRFIKDGSVFFFMDFAVLIVAACITLIIKNLLSEVAAQWVSTIYSIVGSRLVLNIRKAAIRLQRGELSNTHIRVPEGTDTNLTSLIFRSVGKASRSSSAYTSTGTYESTSTGTPVNSYLRPGGGQLSDITEEGSKYEEFEMQGLTSSS